ncbi:MAG: S8 family serine peptidase [Bacteroidia bacterium]|nr:S8 family serine peptidase [Bacteroidia bacterium]
MKNIFTFLLITAGLLLCFVVNAQVNTVVSYQKISSLFGNLTCPLNNSDMFGFSVDNIGDLDNDGVVDMVAGACRDDDGGTDRGAVYILFMNADRTIKSCQKISSAQGGFTGSLANGVLFGTAVSPLGDLDGDGVLDIAVGSEYDSDGGSWNGAVWILFLNSNGTVKAYQKISATQGNFSGTQTKSFGDTLYSPDYPAHADTLAPDTTGGAKSFPSGGGGQLLTGTCTFGSDIALLGDLDGDGVQDIAVGARRNTDWDVRTGAVWILYLNHNGTVKAYSKISAGHGGFPTILHYEDFFGAAVTCLGDMDDDGVPELAVGSYQDDDGGTNKGSVYILFMNADGTVKSYQKISNTQGNFTAPLYNAEYFGVSVKSLGDIDGDGMPDIIAGATGDDDGGADRGAAWILCLNINGTVKTYQKISNTQGSFTGVLDNSDQMGLGVASLGDINNDGNLEIAISAYADDDGGTDRGDVWVMSYGLPIPLTKLVSTDCGATNVALDQTLTAIPVTGATQYEFLVTNSSLGYSQSILKIVNNFTISELTEIAYSTLYNVQVRAYIDLQHGVYGDICEITTELPRTQLSAEFCNATNIKLNQIISADSIPNATEYIFWITDTTFDSVFNKFITSTTRYLDLSSVAGVEFNKTYLVWVSTKINNIQARYGSGCSITTMPYPIDTPVYAAGKIFIKVKDTENTVLLFNSDSSSTFNQNAISNISFINHFGITKIFKPFDVSDVRLSRIYSVEFSHIGKEDSLVLEFQGLNFIEYAEKIPHHNTCGIPNDLNGNQSYLIRIQADLAWNIPDGNNNVIVAVVDDAIRITHEDLTDNIWINQNEIPGILFNEIDANSDEIISCKELINYVGDINLDGVADLLDVIAPGSPIINHSDDDHNGYIDDIFGYDVANNDNNPSPPNNATDLYFTHGTHSAGLIGAKTNNQKGIAALCSKVKIMPVKTKIDGTLNNDLQATIFGIWYAIKSGAKIINMSWASPANTLAEQDLFDYAHSLKIILVAAAGNENTSSSRWPAAYNYVISVGASTMQDYKTSISNYGSTVDFFAPGDNIYSTTATSNTSYGNNDGTSTSCALVSGLCALLLSNDPAKTPDEIYSCILNNADQSVNPPSSGPSKRINAYKSLACVYNGPVANFDANPKFICTGHQINFTDLSLNSPTSYLWTFPGGSPSSSSSQNPVVSYNTSGTYNVSLSVTNSLITHTLSKSQYINVENCIPINSTQNYWHFGNYASLNFSQGYPQPEQTSAMRSYRSCASISDASGHLLFYTNGTRVWNKYNVEITTNSTLLNGGPNKPTDPNFAFQGVIIVPSPSDINKYYIFTVSDDPFGSSNYNYGLCYTIINISGGNATIDLSHRNVNMTMPIIPTTPYVTAIPRFDGNGYWIIVHGKEGSYVNQLLVFPLINSSGTDVVGNPVVSQSYNVTATSYCKSYIKVSRYNKWVAINDASSQHLVFIYKFNNKTGTFSLITTSTDWEQSDICFSADENFLYTVSPPYVRQYDLTNLSICNSILPRFQIYYPVSCGSTCGHPNLQIGPDDKIYITNPGDLSYLSAILSPNVLCTDLNPNACLAAKNVISLSPKYAIYGLPNMIDSKLYTGNPDFTWCIENCNKIHLQVNNYDINSIDFGDGTICLGNNCLDHTYNPISYPATYIVTLQTSTGSKQHTININLPAQPDLSGPLSVCLYGEAQYTTSMQNVIYHWWVSGGQIVGSNSSQSVSVIWNYTGLKAIKLTVTNSSGCTSFKQENINVYSLPSVDVGPDIAICQSASATLIATASGGISPYSYLWSTGQNTQSITVSPVTTSTYYVSVIDHHGCTKSDNVTVTVDPQIFVTVTSVTNATGYNQANGSAGILVSGGTTPYTFHWSNNSITQNLINVIPGTYTVTVTDHLGCTATTTVTISYTITASCSTTNTCPNNNDGTATVSVSNGLAPYTYIWNTNPVQTTQTTSNLSVGTYAVTVTDANGINATATAIIIVDPTLLDNPPPDYYINTSVTWSNSNYELSQDLIIYSGGWLTLQNCTLRFASDYGIIVQPGGKLIVDNRTLLTGLSGCNNYWKGVIVLGVDAPPPSNPYSLSNPHGFLYLRNGSVIEYANIGISIGNSTGTYPQITTQPGGTVWVTGYSSTINRCILRNNRIGIRIIPPANYANKSKFIRCDIICNQSLPPQSQYNGTFTNYAVVGYTPSGLLFDDVTFENTGTIVSKYQVAVYGNLNNSTFQNCHFNNLDYGFFGSYYTFTIQNSFFNNVGKGFMDKGGNIINLNANHFDNIPLPVNSGSGYWYDNNWGIFFNGSVTYDVLNNTFNGSLGSSGTANYGIIASFGFHGTGRIKQNSFTGTTFGLQSQGDNSTLTVRCNNFYSPGRKSLTVVKQYGVGSLMQQGNGCINTTTPAGNEWLYTCNGSRNIYVEGTNATDGINFLYYSHNNTIPTCCSQWWLNNNNLHVCYSIPKTPTSCQDGSKSLNSMQTQSDYESELNNLLTLLSNGDSQTLINHIHANNPEGIVKNELLAASPYLSDRILLAAINERPTPFAPGILKQIIVANSPVTPAVMAAINNRVPALPKGIKQQVMAAQTGTSERTIAISQVNWLKAIIKEQTSNSALQYIAQGDIPAAKQALEQSPYFESKLLLAELLMNENYTADSRDALNDVIEFAPPEELLEAQNFCTLMNVLLDLQQAANNIIEISPSQEISIRQVANSGTVISTWAQAILTLLYGEQFDNPIVQITDQSTSKTSDANTDIENNFYNGFFAKIYPNPNNGNMQIDYSLPISQNGELKIFDINGAELYKLKLPFDVNSIIISDFNFANGIYFYQVFSEGEIIILDKLVIIK